MRQAQSIALIVIAAILVIGVKVVAPKPGSPRNYFTAVKVAVSNGMKSFPKRTQQLAALIKKEDTMDKTSKVIFALIAAALWFDAASNVLLPAHAQQAMPSEITARMKSISDSLATLVQGGINCTNQRLCSQ